MIEVGRFKSDGDNVYGPADYMAERGDKFMEKALSGKSTVLNYALASGSDPVMALLVALQTDYAGWTGMRGLTRMLS